MASYVYIATDQDDREILYAGEDLVDAQSAIRDAVENDSRNMDIEVEDDGSVSINYSGNFKIMEVKVFD